MITLSLFERQQTRGESDLVRIKPNLIFRKLIWNLLLLSFIFQKGCDGMQYHNMHHKMTKRELRQVFDVDDIKNVPPYELIDTTSLYWQTGEQSSGKEHHRLVLDAFNDRFDILLSPHHDSLLSPDLVTIIRDGRNSSLSHGLPKNSRCHFQGAVLSHGNATAALSNCTHLRGNIALSDHFLVIHPIPKRFRSTKNFTTRHVIFKRSPALAPNAASFSAKKMRAKRVASSDYVIEDDPSSVFVDDRKFDEEFCDVQRIDNETVPFLALQDEETGSSFGYGPLTLEIALFLDEELYKHFVDEFGADRAEQELVDFSLALINNVYLLYQQPTMQPKMNVVVVRFELWKSQPEEIEGPKHKNGEAQLFLDTFCTYQAQLNPANRASKTGHWDHATLLTGFDIYHTTSSVAGVAPVARMCDPVFSCSLVEGLHLGRSFVLGHEMGHNLGMVHDGVQNQCSRSCCLMSAVNGAGKTTWSPCSVREFNAYVLSLGSPGAASNCLQDGQNSPEVKDHKLKGSSPGQRFTADQQCAFFWGRDFRNEIPAGKAKSEICNILWCGNGGSTISTSHPALEGTWCGGDKWCRNGQCANWPAGSTPPAAVDGAWSKWIASSRSPCSECKITGGIRIRREIRGCDEPAPNNGGKDCKGSPIRGIVCDSEKPKCENAEKQRYADDVCAALKEDGTGKGDTELSGKSFSHSTSPCKIWCHLGETKLIRNKGFFPDGTPCGIEKFCVEGECLELSCDRKALVFDDTSDCPASAQSAGWSAWSEWSACSTTCGKGSKARTRKCNGNNALCNGKPSEEQECQTAECSNWTQWSPWGDCSATCGTGVRSRSRNCRTGTDCSGDKLEFESCNSTAAACGVSAGIWSEWTAWSVCTKTCGPDGQRSRRRTCEGNNGKCVGDSQQTESCPGKECDDKLPGTVSWSSWGACSASCGPGRQSRTKPCTFNSDPSLLVEHCVDGSTLEYRHCNVKPCGGTQETWSEWSQFSACSVTCGTGHQSRTRTCSSKNGCGAGSSYELLPCFAGKCSGAEPTQAALVVTTTSAASSTNRWSAWEAWSQCSRTCGGGYRQRVRYCLSQSRSQCPPSGSIQIDNCNVQKCDDAWSSWSVWSQCSRTCGSDGRRTRTRQCSALIEGKCDGSNKEESPCDSELPACKSLVITSNGLSPIASSQGRSPEWSQWSSWSACSCFNDKSIRRRYCRVVQPSVLGFCIGPVLDERPCNPSNCTPVPGGWSSWSEWSLCSTDCASPNTGSHTTSGYRIRQRQCSEPFPVNRGPYCFGQSFEKSPCSASLPSCSGSAIDGGWSEWSSWSSCSTSCNTGHRSRTRYCTNPRPANGGQPCQGLDFNLEVCQPLDSCQSSTDSGWGVWSSWSSCSQSCGFAFQSRQRFCDSPKPTSSHFCAGLAYMTRLCTIPQCQNAVAGEWSAWSEWSGCSVQCGYGVRARTRNCDSPHPSNGGTPCLGASTDVVLCTGQQKECDRIDEHFDALENLARKWENN